MKITAKMLMEHGFAPGEPGMEASASVIPAEQKMNPNCPCETRTCPLHGFCEYCVQHHAELNRMMQAMGVTEHCHFHHCKQEKLLAKKTHEEVSDLCLAPACAACEKAARARAGEDDMPLHMGEIGIGRTVVDQKSGMRFLVAAQDHYGPGITTLLAENVVEVRALDGAESGKPGAYPFEQSGLFGNNNYPLSNLHQYLNSDAENWYQPTHEKDTPPDGEHVRYGECPYADEPGFLVRFSDTLKRSLVETDIPVLVRKARNKGEMTTVKAKVFLPSLAEMNKGDEAGFAEGKTLPVFYDHSVFKAKPTQEQLDRYGRSWNPPRPDEGVEYDAAQIYDPKYGWWYYMRTPNLQYKFLQRVMTAYGSVSYTYANNDVAGLRPLFNVSADMPVYDMGDAFPEYHIV